MRRLALLTLVLAAGCAEPPAIGAPDPQAMAAPWPKLEPLDEVLARADALTITPETNADLAARAAALRARAARLRAMQPGG